MADELLLDGPSFAGAQRAFVAGCCCDEDEIAAEGRRMGAGIIARVVKA